MGGEKLIAEGIQRATPGSPPRGRGKATFPSRRPAFRRITPAWAGKRLQHTVGNPTGQDHPRVGGEKHCPHGINMTFGGSPPRGRGKDTPIGETGAMSGITPAWAGKSCSSAEALQAGQDHPRVGGEKIFRVCVLSLFKGSPPRGRGKVMNSSSSICFCGITPAWAGKSRVSSRYGHDRQDHPRVGGEKSVFLCSARSGRGSPPRGRGKARW